MITIGQLDINRTLMTMFFNDIELKGYMGIPSADLNNIVKFRDKYVCNAFSTEALVVDEVSRIVYRSANMTETRNAKVKMNYLMIEVFVRVSDEYNVDPVDRLRRRQDMIARRIMELLNDKLICGFRFRLVDMGDLYCQTPNYHRMFLKFEHKFIG